jgi:addiction module HigA family antidote
MAIRINEADMRAVQHPGAYIKDHVLPAGISVTRAAEVIGVGRPALSNLLNGRAALSRDMAMRLEKAFGVSRETLLQKQVEYDEALSRQREKEVPVRTYVPRFMDITATQIEDWADKKLEARSELPALLRKLVLSTGKSITKVDFPAFDNAQRHGWDGQVETDFATPWIPAGLSGWEFGCDASPKTKADGDYATRLRGTPREERERTTFVFVTPRNWRNKDDWAKEKSKEGNWKGVRAFDASDLEQWLGQSIPAQGWMADRLGVGDPNIVSLDECWDSWAKVTEPIMSRSLFGSAVNAHRETLARWLASPPSQPLIVASDSSEESLAYLACAMGAENQADKALVLRSVEALRRVARTSSNFIAVLASSDVEAASAGLHTSQHTIIIRHRTSVENKPDIELDLVDDKTFKDGLTEMGCDDERIESLSRESGQSLTILRRRLSHIPAIQTPPWATNSVLSRRLIAFGFVGAWDSVSPADKDILSFLAEAKTYEEVERLLAELLGLEHSPVWAVGRYRGVASKLDVLLATHRLVTADDLERLFFTAELVLSERDPALDLPEDKRFAAGIYGKTRDHSAGLREGICDTLVLLSIHGDRLFRERLGFSVEDNVRNIVRKLLVPFSGETWASQRSDLPRYAEAAPDLFLDIVEQDLRSSDPQILSLLRPAASGIFGGGCARSGLLWALELLAWTPERLPRVADVLAQLAAIRIDDNWVNKPEHSLKSIFRAWMPQTSAGLETRVRVLQSLVARHSDVAWQVCVDQFDPSSTIGNYSSRPRWRKDATGAGQPVSRREAFAFARKALDVAIDWPAHNEQTLGELVQHSLGLEEQDQRRIWDRVDAWIDSGPSDQQKVALRERIRVSSMTVRARKRDQGASQVDRAKHAYDRLAVNDPVVRNQWLFARDWIEESWEENEDEQFDYQRHEKKIAELREEAVREVWAAARYDGILKLAEGGEAPAYVGFSLAAVAPDGLDAVVLIRTFMARAGSTSRSNAERCLTGYLLRLDDAARSSLLARAINQSEFAGEPNESMIIRLLDCAPFRRTTWLLVNGLPDKLRERYWKECTPNSFIDDDDELNELVVNLLAAKRPKTAFEAARLFLAKLDSPTITRLLNEIAGTASEWDGQMHFSSWDFGKAFEILDSRMDVSTNELASLEFKYLSALEHEKRGIPALERQVSETPALFMQAVGLTYKRSEPGDDPPEWSVPSGSDHSAVSTQTYRLLLRIRRIPGTQDDGQIDAKQLRQWIGEVRSLAKTYGRERVADHCIGELLSKSTADEDGIWPRIAIRDVLEELGNEKIADAMAVGLYNQRGAHYRDVGGKQERELAAKYRGWSKRTVTSWPFTSRLLENIALGYDREAHWHDTDANVSRRLPK